MSDSEYEFQVPPAKSKKTKKSPTPAKASCSKQTSEEPVRSQKRKVTDIFGLQSNDDEGGAVKTSLPSFIVNKVANGVQRRSSSTTGPFYLELRVYDRCDAETTESDERWKKALLRLACSVDEDSSQWKALQRLVKEVNELFKDSDPIFMSGSVNFKKK